MDDNCSSAIETIPALLLKKRKYINVTENTEKKLETLCKIRTKYLL